MTEHAIKKEYTNLRRLQLTEVEDLLYGACIYGTGVGGSLDEALETVRRLYAVTRLPWEFRIH
jgi:hypothetical protein